MLGTSFYTKQQQQKLIVNDKDYNVFQYSKIIAIIIQ